MPEPSDLNAAAATFLALGPTAVVIKLAEAGCLVATREHPEPTGVPTDVIEPVDSTGAGDAFCGAFAAEHLRSGDVYAAARAGARPRGSRSARPVSADCSPRRRRGVAPDDAGSP